MWHEPTGLAALLATSAVGYLVCVKANSEKKGSVIKGVGLALGSIIIIISLLGSLYLAAKSVYYKCFFDKKMHCEFKGMMHKGPEGPQH
jgi:hypothetical protein